MLLLVRLSEQRVGWREIYGKFQKTRGALGLPAELAPRYRIAGTPAEKGATRSRENGRGVYHQKRIVQTKHLGPEDSTSTFSAPLHLRRSESRSPTLLPTSARAGAALVHGIGWPRHNSSAFRLI